MTLSDVEDLEDLKKRGFKIVLHVIEPLGIFRNRQPGDVVGKFKDPANAHIYKGLGVIEL